MHLICMSGYISIIAYTCDAHRYYAMSQSTSCMSGLSHRAFAALPPSQPFHLFIVPLDGHKDNHTQNQTYKNRQPHNNATAFLTANLSSLIDDQIQHSKSPRCVANLNNPYPFSDCVPTPCPCVCAMMDIRQHIQPDANQRDHTLKNEENDKEMI